MQRFVASCVALLALAASQAQAAQDAAADVAPDPAQLVAEAEKRFKETTTDAAKKMAKLTDFRTTWQTMDPDSILAECQKDAHAQMAKEVSDKKQELDQLIHHVSSVVASPSDADVLAVKKSARTMVQAEKNKFKAVKDAMKQRRKAELAQCKEVGRDAMEALRAQKDAARKLEAARKKAGVSEHAYEGKYEQVLHAIEKQQDQAGNARDQACDATEARFSQVEHKVEAMIDHSSDQAENKVEDIMRGFVHQLQANKAEQAQKTPVGHSSSSSDDESSSSHSKASHSSSDSEDKKSSSSSSSSSRKESSSASSHSSAASHDESPSSSSPRKSQSSAGAELEKAEPEKEASKALAGLGSFSTSPIVMYSGAMGFLLGTSVAAAMWMSRGRRVVGAQPLLLG